ncbi:MAG: tetratricopeptide repeat protein [Coriobacteriia bacterium]|nr:tetratricopeptide repeat protein [Coriobacteriia bacterium]
MDQETSRRSTAVSATDPWVRRLLVAVLVTLVLVLTAVVYMVYTGVLTAQAPRTLAEKQTAMLDQAFKATPDDPVIVADYMRALIAVERYANARSVLKTYRSGETAAAAVVTVEEARLLDATGDSEEALKVLDTAADEARAQKESIIQGQLKRGITAPVSAPVLVDALLLKVEILQRDERLEEALSALDEALEEQPTMADVFSWRGDINASLGRVDEARADYEKALGMIPDYQPALDGLSALEGGGL